MLIVNLMNGFCEYPKSELVLNIYIIELVLGIVYYNHVSLLLAILTKINKKIKITSSPFQTYLQV